MGRTTATPRWRPFTGSLRSGTRVPYEMQAPTYTYPQSRRDPDQRQVRTRHRRSSARSSSSTGRGSLPCILSGSVYRRQFRSLEHTHVCVTDFVDASHCARGWCEHGYSLYRRSTSFGDDGMSGVSRRDGRRVRQQLHGRQLAAGGCGSLRLRQRFELRERIELQRVELRNLLGLEWLIRLEQWLDLRRPIELRRRLELRERRGVQWGRTRCRNVTDGRRRRADRWRRRRIGDVRRRSGAVLGCHDQRLEPPTKNQGLWMLLRLGGQPQRPHERPRYTLVHDEGRRVDDAPHPVWRRTRGCQGGRSVWCHGVDDSLGDGFQRFSRRPRHHHPNQPQRLQRQHARAHERPRFGEQPRQLGCRTRNPRGCRSTPCPPRTSRTAAASTRRPRIRRRSWPRGSGATSAPP